MLWGGLFFLLMFNAYGGADSDTVESPLWKLTGPTMGTRYAVSVVGCSEQEAEAIGGQIDFRLTLINRRMST